MFAEQLVIRAAYIHLLFCGCNPDRTHPVYLVRSAQVSSALARITTCPVMTQHDLSMANMAGILVQVGRRKHGAAETHVQLHPHLTGTSFLFNTRTRIDSIFC